MAERLAWDFIDFDEAIERRTGKRIVDIFREDGEETFRGLEAETTHEVRDLRCVVLAPGGGWVTQSALVNQLRPGSHIVWLRVEPETVLERHAGQPGVERPLLAVDDPLVRVRSLLSEREPAYRLADAVIDTDGDGSDAVAARVLESLGRG